MLKKLPLTVTTKNHSRNIGYCKAWYRRNGSATGAHQHDTVSGKNFCRFVSIGISNNGKAW